MSNKETTSNIQQRATLRAEDGIAVETEQESIHPVGPDDADPGTGSSDQDDLRIRMIVIRKLMFRRGSREILKDINLEINHGTVVAIMGMSGCGKSTLLRLIAGLERPHRGGIYVAGTDIARLSEQELDRVRRTMGFVFQGAALFDYLTVFENVAFPLRRNSALNEKQIGERVASMLSLVGLDGTDSLLPSELSGGMQKRVGLARAIAMDPPPQIVLYDEPTSGLDPIMTAVINDLIMRVRDELGVTSVMVTHDMKSIRSADQVAMIHGGMIEALGTPAEIMDSANPVVDQFIHGRAEGPIDVVHSTVEL